MVKKALLILVLLLVLLLVGCHWFADNRIVVKPEPIDTSSYEFRRTLAMFIKARCKTEMTVKEIMAELAYQEYLRDKK